MSSADDPPQKRITQAKKELKNARTWEAHSEAFDRLEKAVEEYEIHRLFASTPADGAARIEAVAKDAAERAGKNASVAPQLLYADILWAMQRAGLSDQRPAILTDEQLRDRLFEVGKPSLREWCRVHGVNNAHANEFATGVRGPGTDLLLALGLTKTYTTAADTPI